MLMRAARTRAVNRTFRSHRRRRRWTGSRRRRSARELAASRREI